jgi:hypothetical protein
MAGPARGRPTSRPRPVSPRSIPRQPPSAVVRGTKDRRHGAPPRGGAGNTLRPRKWARLATGVRALRESDREQGSLPDGGETGSIDRARRRTVGSRPHGRSSTWRKRVARQGALEDAVRSGPARPSTSARRPNPRAAGADSRGEKAQESTDPLIAPRPGLRSPGERTLEGSKASKRACRPPSPASPADPRRDAAHARGNTQTSGA